MRVNTAVAGFYCNLLLVRPRVSIVLFTVFLIASSFTEHSGRDLRAKQVNLIVRQIGDRLLLQGGDATSRVLPVTEIKEGRFLLRFENKFVFNHDSLLSLALHYLPKTQFASGYTITVNDCKKGDIVYGFQVNNTSPDILPCQGRSQPPGCYTIEFTFPNLYENIKYKLPGTGQLTESAKIAPQDINLKPEELKTTAVNNNIDQRTEELKSIKIDPKVVNPKIQESKTTIFSQSLIKVICIGMLVLLSITMFIGRFGKISKPAPLQTQNYGIPKEAVPEPDALGKFSFNAKGQRLLLGNEVISLTDKECKVLALLHKNFGELIPRETLMQEVWINDGVITGRSLDMFISKLRKKLSIDPDLRITNIHGKGYRLETLND